MSEVGVPLRWRVLIDGPFAGATNMARDEALARLVSATIEEDGEAGGVDALPAFLRFYAWDRPTLSFGRNEPTVGRFDAEHLAGAGVDVVRRPTGGRAVLHDREVTYAVVVPARALGGPRETYRRVNEVLAAGLGALGVEVTLARDGPVAALDAGPCFDLPAGGEVVARDRKLVGSAQARLGGALLQHGSILLHDDQGRIEELSREGTSSSRAEEAGGSRPVALDELLERAPTFHAIVEAVTTAASGALPGDWRSGGSVVGLDTADIEGRYRDEAWTWRR